MAEDRSERMGALDVLRGLAVAGMILVTSPGDWMETYSPLKHADWHGWTAADMVFPAFLFSVGMALGLSFPRPLADPAARAALWGRVARRAVALVLLGLLLNWTYVLAVAAGVPPAGPDASPALRLPGVLQRIAFCYVLAVGLILLTARRSAEGRTAIEPRAILIAIVTILLAYWALLSFVPVPGHGAGQLDPEGSLAAWLDRAIFTPAHMWPLGSATWRGPVTYDPEGLLSSFPATVNVLFGVLAGWAWRRAPERAAVHIAVAGALLVLLGLLLDPLFPINKRLWTSSFALLSSGIPALALAATLLLVRSGTASRLATPLKVLGGNAILAFTISILAGAFAGLPLGGPEGAISPQAWGDALASRIIPDPYLASLACALAILTLITLALWPLHRRAIHFRL